jgi:hypothetical protein
VVFIKMEMVPPSKFHPKLNKTSRQHQSNATTCHLIKKIKKLYIFFLKKIGGGSLAI